MESSTDGSPAGISARTAPLSHHQYENTGDNKNGKTTSSTTANSAYLSPTTNTGSAIDANVALRRPRTETMWAQPRPYSMPVDQVRYEPTGTAPGTAAGSTFFDTDPQQHEQLYEMVEMDRLGSAATAGGARKRRSNERSVSSAHILPNDKHQDPGANNMDGGKEDEIRRLRRLVIIFGVIAVLALIVAAVGVTVLCVRFEVLSNKVEDNSSQLAASSGEGDGSGSAGSTSAAAASSTSATGNEATMYSSIFSPTMPSTTAASTTMASTAMASTTIESTSTIDQSNLYAMGGLGQDSMSSMEVFDGQQWMDAPSMPTPRAAGIAIAFQGLVYAIGGFDGSKHVGDVDYFDGSEWQSHSLQMPTKRNRMAGAVYRDVIYILGGRTTNRKRITTVEAFDGERWFDDIADLNTGRMDLCAVVFNDRLYAIGGETRDEAATASVETFDGIEWSLEETSMPVPRAQAAAVVFNNKIYVVGGKDQNRRAETTVVFDGSVWDESQPAPTARTHGAAAVFQGLLYFIGGDRSDTFRKVEVFDGSRWQDADSLRSSRYFGSAVVY